MRRRARASLRPPLPHARAAPAPAVSTRWALLRTPPRTSQILAEHWYSRSRSVPATPRGLPADAIANSPGCMSMVHLIFAPGAGCVGRPPSSDHQQHAVAGVVSNSRHLNSSSPASHKKGGLEAPRNSLELEGDELRDIQIGVQVEPAFDALVVSGRRSTGSRATAPSSEAGTPRTPSLVARLMGIDGLPDSSPSPGLKKNNPRVAVVKEKKKRVIPESMNRQPLRSLSCNVGANEARSLPDTPRASASSARSASAWDVVDRPRLSLQVLKENVLDRAAQYMSMPTSPTSSSKKNKDKKDGHRRRDSLRELVGHLQVALPSTTPPPAPPNLLSCRRRPPPDPAPAPDVGDRGGLGPSRAGARSGWARPCPGSTAACAAPWSLSFFSVFLFCIWGVWYWA